VIDSELLKMLESTVLIASPSSRGLDGKVTYGTAVSYQAHVEDRRDMVRNASGEEVMSAGRCHLDSHYGSLSESARVTLPSGKVETIVALESTYDSDGPYQTVVYF